MIKLSKSRKSYKIFYKFLISVLPIFIIPVIVMVVIYYSSNSVNNKQTFERNLAVLQSSADTIQKTFVNIDNLISYLNRNSSINDFLTSVNPIKDRSTTIDMLNTESDLKSLTITNNIIRNIQLYSYSNNIIVDSATCGLYLDRYYSYNNIKGVTFADWQEEFLKPKHRYKIFTDLNVVNLGQSSKNIIYAESLPLSQTRDFKGTVFIYLDEEYLLSQFGKIPYQNSGLIYILDENGKIILYDNKSELMNPLADAKNFIDNSGYFFQNLSGKEMFITYYKEARRNWVFVAALPKNQVLAPTSSIRLYIDLLILFTVLSGGFLVITSVLRLSKPISHIFALFAEKNQNLSYNDFEYEISKLVDNNENWRRAYAAALFRCKRQIEACMSTRGE